MNTSLCFSKSDNLTLVLIQCYIRFPPLGKSTYRGDYTPNKIDMTFRTQTADTVTSYVVGQANGRPSSANVMPIKRAKPTG